MEDRKDVSVPEFMRLHEWAAKETANDPPDAIEDDVVQLIEWLAEQAVQGVSTAQTKRQLRDALDGLIDSRIAAALQSLDRAPRRRQSR